MVEIEIARFEYAHHLKSHSRFSVEGNGCGTDELQQQALQRDAVHVEMVVFDE